MVIQKLNPLLKADRGDVKPNDVVTAMLSADEAKASLPANDLLFGGLLSGALIYVTLTNFGIEPASRIAAKIVAIAEVQTIGHSAHGWSGLGAVIGKSILWNWMVFLGVFMALSTQSTLGKIVAAWHPCRPSSAGNTAVVIDALPSSQRESIRA